jgi:hypothetical protein
MSTVKPDRCMNVHIPEETYFWTLISLGQQRKTKKTKGTENKGDTH